MERVIEVFVELDGTSQVEDDMRAVVTDLVNSISTWRNEAKRIGVSAEEINRMATAFEHDEMVRAQRYLRSVS